MVGMGVERMPHWYYLKKKKAADKSPGNWGWGVQGEPSFCGKLYTVRIFYRQNLHVLFSWGGELHFYFQLRYQSTSTDYEYRQ